jgi:splicing factor 3B subunit 2
MAADLSSDLPNGTPAPAGGKKSRENERRRRRRKQKKNKGPSDFATADAVDAGEEDKPDSKHPVRVAPPGSLVRWYP